MLIDDGRLHRDGPNVTVALSWRPYNGKRAARGQSVAGEHLLQRALVAGRRFGSGVFLSAVSAARMRAIRRTAVCLKDAGQTRLEGILARPRFLPDPRWTRKGVPRDRPGRPRGRLTRALVWAAVADGQRERETVVSKLGTLIVRARALGPWRWRGAGGGGGDGTTSLMRPRRVSALGCWCGRSRRGDSGPTREGSRVCRRLRLHDTIVIRRLMSTSAGRVARRGIAPLNRSSRCCVVRVWIRRAAASARGPRAIQRPCLRGHQRGSRSASSFARSCTRGRYRRRILAANRGPRERAEGAASTRGLLAVGEQKREPGLRDCSGGWPGSRPPGVWAPAPRSVVVVPSRTIDRWHEPAAEARAYEERMLSALFELRDPSLRITYVTSAPIAPAIIDYYLSLLPRWRAPWSSSTSVVDRAGRLQLASARREAAGAPAGA